MTKVNSNNRNKTKSAIFSWGIFKSDIIFHWSQNTKISMTFITGTFQVQCKSEHKQVK